MREENVKDDKNLSKIFESSAPSVLKGKSDISRFISLIDEQNAAHDRKFKKIEKDIEDASRRPRRKKLAL